MTNYEKIRGDNDIVRCYECKHYQSNMCPMVYQDSFADDIYYTEIYNVDQSRSDGFGFCDAGERDDVE